MKTKIYIIVGPTSSGKTTLAIELCQKFNGEIISADSRQVYKYMDIGTNKDRGFPPPKIPIWGYDLIEPNEFFSAYEFSEYALEKTREILKKGKKVFVVGGTGFFIDLYTGKVKPSLVKPNMELRKELASLPLNILQERLKAVNPKKFELVDKNNPVRLIRALEQELSANKQKPLNYLKDVEFVKIGLTASREELYKRVDLWTEKIFEKGIIKETNWLLENGYQDSKPMQGIIYKTVVLLIEGKIAKKEAIERVKFDLHSYIRRQQTYFKKDPDIHWYNICDEANNCLLII